MDSLWFRTGLHGIIPAISVGNNLEARRNPSQFSATAAASGRDSPAAEKSGDGRAALSRLLFKSPLMDDAVLMECKQGNGGRGEEEEEGKEGVGNSEQSEGQNGNWVFQILHVKSLWSDQKGEEEEREVDDQENESSSSSSPCSSSAY